MRQQWGEVGHGLRGLFFVGALLFAHLSPKRGVEIGRFGLGFKSVLGISRSPEIFSRSGSLVFDPHYAETMIREAIPDRPDALYATVQMIAAKAVERDAKAVLIYVGRLPAEFRVAAMAALQHRRSPVCETPAFVAALTGSASGKWAAQ